MDQEQVQQEQIAPGTVPQQFEAGPPAGSPCRFFAAGNCRYGQSCRYSHNDSGAPIAPIRKELPSQPSSLPCRFFASGKCKFGHKCLYYHSQQALNRNQNRLTPASPPPGSPCRFFAQGRCRFGPECKFSHDPSIMPQQGFHGYGHVPMDPAMLAQVEAELAMEAELDAAIDATIDARIRAEYEQASMEEEAMLADEGDDPSAQPLPNGNAEASTEVQTDKSG